MALSEWVRSLFQHDVALLLVLGHIIIVWFVVHTIVGWVQAGFDFTGRHFIENVRV